MNDDNEIEKKVDSYFYRISHKNINEIKFPSPHDFNTILFDSNLNCNLHCVYCHNNRDTKTVSEEDFLRFIDTQVNSVNDFQLGCAMEPTMDKRMTKFALMVSKSKAKPKRTFRLQTNGTLLHIHNIDELRTAGINKITVSIDTIDPEIHREMRGGSDLEKILTNIKNLRQTWPESRVEFITTVNARNLPKLEDLCQYAIDNQIYTIELRNMFYIEKSKIIKDHEKMKSLLLTDSEFDTTAEILAENYKYKLRFHLNNADKIEAHKSNQRVKTT